MPAAVAASRLLSFTYIYDFLSGPKAECTVVLIAHRSDRIVVPCVEAHCDARNNL